MDDVLRHQDGVGGAPGLYALGVQGEPGRNLVQLLGDEAELEGLSVDGFHAGVAGLDVLFHVGLEVFPDDVDDLAETGFHGVVDGIVDDGLSVGAEAVHLLESAVAAAHAGGQDEKGRFHMLENLNLFSRLSCKFTNFAEKSDHHPPVLWHKRKTRAAC